MVRNVQTIGEAIRVADEVWIALALLHRENPDRPDFTVAEIVAMSDKENAVHERRPGVYVHAMQHCVAGRAPNPGRYRMLTETGKNRRRLFRPGDAFHPARAGSKTLPDRAELPEKYHELLDWYRRDYIPRDAQTTARDPLLELRGSGKDIWADEHADEYLRHLRGGWE
jgi:hypothetical protein